MSEIELKPCPFCDSKAILFKSGAGYWGTCTNEECECETPGRTDPEEAAAIWNRRTLSRPEAIGEGVGMKELEEAIYRTMREFRLSNMLHEEGDHYCLVDAMTADGRDISDGEEQMRELAWEIGRALSYQRGNGEGRDNG